MAADKTDANDADGLARLAEAGFRKAVRVEGFHGMSTRTLAVARTRPVRIVTEPSNQVRALTKTFGLVVPPVTGGRLECQVAALLTEAGVAVPANSSCPSRRRCRDRHRLHRRDRGAGRRSVGARVG